METLGLAEWMREPCAQAELSSLHRMNTMLDWRENKAHQPAAGRVGLTVTGVHSCMALLSDKLLDVLVNP